MRALARLTFVEAKLFVREPMALIFVFAFPFFVLFVLGGVFGTDLDTNDPEEVRIWRGVAPTDYYQPAYVGLVVASVGLITMPLRLTGYREQGVLRRFRAAGVPLSAVLGSQLAVAFMMATIGGIGLVIASSLAYDTMLPESWLLTLAAYVLAVLMFGAIGLMLGSLLPTSRSAQGAGFTLFFVMMFISGAGPPREVLTDAMRQFSNVLPLTHVIVLLQDAWLAASWDLTAFAVVAGFLVVTGALAARFFRWE